MEHHTNDANVEVDADGVTLDEALSTYLRDANAASQAETKRQEIIKLFPLANWPTLPLQRYALGQGDSHSSWCWWLEYNSTELGSIKGGSAKKHLIFKAKDGWYFDPHKGYSGVQKAWEAVRGDFARAFELAHAEQFDQIDALPAISNGPTIKLKSLYIYFPDKLLPIYSTPHLRHFLGVFGQGQQAEEIGWEPVNLNRALLAAVQQDARFARWTALDVMRFLYRHFDPRADRPPHAGKTTPDKGPPLGGPTPSVQDPLFEEIADAMERKGQVILYGPPGTGKTYLARRFAVWWLLARAGEKAGAVLGDAAAFARSEAALSTVQIDRRVWWVVANPSVWRWDQLFADGAVEYDYGRLQKNYPLAQQGDLVIGYQSTPDKRIVALARVSRAFGPNAKGELCLPLEPLAKVTQGLTYEELLDDPLLRMSEPMRFRNQGTLFSLTADEADLVLAMLSEKNPSLRQYIEPETADDVGQLTRLTFHPSYTYEDFIEGFRPVDTGSGTLNLRLEDGVFKRVCRHAQANPTKSYVVLIDEINRANIAKVFGEIITLLERDKRGLIVTLPQSKQSFAIPENVYILGTMNTADRSIKLLDAALRRRFAFIEIMPDVTLLQGAVVGDLPLDRFLGALNSRIARLEGREKQIGHSFLLDDRQPVDDLKEFADRFRQEILPLLQEYCYDDYAELAQYIGNALIDKQAQTLNREILDDPQRLIAALREELLGESQAQ